MDQKHLRNDIEPWTEADWNKPSAASAGYRVEPVSVELLPCPDCGADPAKFCVIHSVNGREPHDRNHVQAECTKCGFSVMVRCSAKATVIRRFWNAGR